MVDVERYGGRRAFVEHVRARALYAIGAYGKGHDIEWAAVQRLAFVCKGNICRSPYACARARELGVPAASFGLETAGGSPANSAAARNARARGLDLSTHRSVRLESAVLGDGDLIVVFEPAQRAEVRRRCGDGPQSALLGIWSRPIRPYIHDPYGSSDRYFQHCFVVIDRNIAQLVDLMAAKGAPAAASLRAKVVDGRAAHGNSRDGMPI